MLIDRAVAIASHLSVNNVFNVIKKSQIPVFALGVGINGKGSGL